MCRYNKIFTRTEVDLSTINNSDCDRDRGLEVLLYNKKEEEEEQELKPQEKKDYELSLLKIFSLFKREITFKLQLVVNKKFNSQEETKC